MLRKERIENVAKKRRTKPFSLDLAWWNNNIQRRCSLDLVSPNNDTNRVDANKRKVCYKNIARIANAVQVTLWLSITNPQCHGSSISILSLFSSFFLFVFVVVPSTPTLNIKIKSKSLKSVHRLITEWVTRSPNELNILSLVQVSSSLVEKHPLTINTAICDTSLQYQGSLDWWICHITICCFKWHILKARFNIR